jgi:hypothetical protein
MLNMNRLSTNRTFDEATTYGLAVGRYLLTNVPASHPIALLNQFDLTEREDSCAGKCSGLDRWGTGAKKGAIAKDIDGNPLKI